MKIVIDISEKDYRDFVLQNDNGILDEKTPSHRAKIAIANGQILPKGHGRLIDADRMKRWVENCECCSICKEKGLNCNQDCKFPDYLDDVWERAINEQLTIVEADKEGAEE